MKYSIEPLPWLFNMIVASARAGQSEAYSTVRHGNSDNNNFVIDWSLHLQ